MLDLETETTTPPPQKHFSYYASLAAAFLFGILALLVIAWRVSYLPVVSTMIGAAELKVGASAPASQPFSSVAGHILLNLALPNAASELYSFNLSSDQLGLSTIQATTPSTSVDGRYVVGIAQLPASKGGAINVYRYNLETGTSSILAAGYTQSPLAPQLSPDDTQVAFDELPASSASESIYDPGTWNIAITDGTTPPRVIAHGLYPHWSPDGSMILYLGDDGLHLYSIASGKDSLVWNIHNGSAKGIMMFSVSKDGTKIAWTNPDYEQIMIASITSWEPFTFAGIASIDLYGSYPIFSPDGTEVAFEQYDWDGSTTTQPTKQQLAIFDIASGQTETVADLSMYNPAHTFITSWTN